MFLTSKLQVDVPSVTFPQMLLPRLLACGDTMAVVSDNIIIICNELKIV